jgi:acetate---CoA ligase (ADP-forming)
MTDADVRAVRRFLAPASIAIVGASGDETVVSGRPLVLLRQHGYTGPIYPVNPRHQEISGLPCYASVKDIPGPVDLALVVVPAARVPAVIADCRDAGVPAAYVISSGFDEALQATAGTDASQSLREAIAGHATRISGPNAEGIYNIIDDIALGFSPTTDYKRGLAARPRPGNVAVVAQSGGLGFGIMNQGLARGIDFSYVISTGNETDLGVLEYVEYLITDEHTNVIALFLEGVERPLQLRDLGLRAAAAGKVIVAAKVGRSPEAQRAAVSHTGHVTGASHLWSALFRQAGIVEVTDIAEFLDVLAVVSRFGPAPGRRTAVITVSGGAGVWLTDALRAQDLEVPVLDQARQDQLAPLLPYYASTANPVDMTAGGASVEVQRQVIATVGHSPDVDMVIVISSLMNPETGRETAERCAGVAAEIGKPLITYSYTAPGDGVVDAFAELGIPVLLSQSGAARALRGLADLGQREPAPADAGPPSRLAALPGADDFGATVLTEAQVKGWLAANGLAVPPADLVRSRNAAVAAAAALGYPVVLKVQAAALPHKSDAGVLALGLRTDDEVAAAYDRLWARAQERTALAGIDGVLVERMVDAGFEMLVGLTRHPALGPFLTVGAGGSQTEIFRDVAVLPAPATPHQVRAALTQLRCAAAFTAGPATPGSAKQGAGTALDVTAFCDLAARISVIAAATADLAELDVNPVIVHPAGGGADIADALAVRLR